MKNNFITQHDIRKIEIAQGDDCITGCQFNYNSFDNYYKMTGIVLCKQQALAADPKSS